MSVLKTWQNMESGLYDFTVDGKCSNCGECCSNYLPVSDKEINAIRRYIKQHGIKEIKHFLPTAKPATDLQCPFRSDLEKKCTIYPVRPAICRDFQCDKPRKHITADREMYNGKYGVISMKAVFYGTKTPMDEMLELAGLIE